MITPDGWFDFAERVPGPPDKVYSEPNVVQGYVPHSAVGSYDGWVSRLFSTQREVTGRYTEYSAASVHGFILKNGHVIQHYPVYKSCWASGSRFPNVRFTAFENEGGFIPFDEPLTDAQVLSNIHIISELSRAFDWTPSRPVKAGDTTATLYEHRECARFGSAPTACPSNRIPWPRIMSAINLGGEERVFYTDERLKEIIGNMLGSLQHALGVSTELAAAFADHVRGGHIETDPFFEDFDPAVLKAEITELNEKLDKIAKVLTED